MGIDLENNKMMVQTWSLESGPYRPKYGSNL